MSNYFYASEDVGLCEKMAIILKELIRFLFCFFVKLQKMCQSLNTYAPNCTIFPTSYQKAIKKLKYRKQTCTKSVLFTVVHVLDTVTLCTLYSYFMRQRQAPGNRPVRLSLWVRGHSVTRYWQEKRSTNRRP